MGNPSPASHSSLPVGSVEAYDDELFLTLTARVSSGADDAVLIPEHSTDLTAWDSSGESIVPVSATPDDNGGTTYRWRSAQPMNGDVREYLRLRVQLR